MVENVMEEEDIEECIKKVNAIDNGIQLFIQNISQNFEKFKNLKKRYLDKLVDYKVFLGDCDNKKDKEKRFREVEDVSKEFKTSVKSFIEYDEGTKNFIRTIDKENEALTNQINSYKNTLKDIEKYIKKILKNISKTILSKKNLKKRRQKKKKKKKNPKKKKLKKKKLKKRSQKKRKLKKKKLKKKK